MICQRHISFIEETIGEKWTRLSLALISFSVAIAHCLALVFNGMMLNGTLYNVLTSQLTIAGELIYCAE
jgi:hypothetical protein